MFPREDEFKEILVMLGRSENTIKAYKRDLNFLFSCCDCITTESIQEASFTLTKKGGKPSTIRRFLSSVKTYCELFEISVNFKKIAKPKLVQRESVYITDSVFSQGIGIILADTISSDEKKFRSIIFNVLYKTGIRVSELISLSINNYSKEEKCIQIIGKGNKQRKVPIHESISDVFDMDWFFVKINSTHYNTILYWTKKYFGSDFSPHSFRHGFTTKLVKNGVSERSVQKVLGHESFVTTLRYFHMNQDEITGEIFSALEEKNND